jgi:hypothetical protein
MRIVKILSPLFLMLITAAFSALAQTTIISPSNNEQVSSPFTLNMSATSCSSKPATAVGYSLDNSASTSSWSAQSIDGPVAAPSGTHTLHVKVWNEAGGVCVTDVTVDVNEAGTVASGALAVVPSNATTVSGIQALDNWIAIHDGGTPGSSSGAMSMINNPSLTGAAKLFANQFKDFGGERFSVQFADDVNATKFFYDGWVYIADNANGFSNLEFDLEQTMANGETVIMGFQCDSWNGTWDYAVNGGSATKPNDTWGHSSAACNVRSWGANQWHHVQIHFSRNDSGWVTYNSVWLDGTEQSLNVTAFSGFALGWGPAIVTNFQIDGASSGTTWGNVYLDELEVYRW